MDVFVGEIRAFSFDFAPIGWVACDGQSYPSGGSFRNLATVLNNIYGGNSQSFNVPDLRGRVLTGTGQLKAPFGADNYVQGAAGGVEAVALGADAVPPHSHPFVAASAIPATVYLANGTKVAGNGTSNISNTFEHAPTGINRIVFGGKAADPNTLLAAAALTPFTGGSNQPHTNMQPYVAINYCINYDGFFPDKP